MKSLPVCFDELQGQTLIENQNSNVLQKDEGGGHAFCENQCLPAPSLLNVYVRLFENSQQERLSVMNQMRCYLRDSVPKEQWPCKDLEKSFNDKIVMESEALPIDLRDYLKNYIVPKEKDTKKMMVREMKKHKLAPFFEGVRGMGASTLAARLMHRLDGKHFPTVLHLWSYCGLDGPEWRKRPHNWALTSICFNIAESFQKQPTLSGGYRDIYDKRKEYETTKPPCAKCEEQGFEEHCRPGHINNKARRYAVKMFLKDLWVEMQGQVVNETQKHVALH